MDSKRFVPRSPNKRPETYFISANEFDSNVSSKIPQPPTLPLPSSPAPTTVRSADVTTPRTEVVHPARRIVVIRNTRHHQSDQGSVDLGEFGRPNSVEVSPAISHGNRSVYLIRRPIAPDSSNSIQFYQTVQEPLPTTPLEHTRTPTTTLEHTRTPTTTLEYSRTPTTTLEHTRTPTTTLEHTRTPTPPKEIVTSSDQPRSPSPRRSPSIHPKSSKRLTSPIQTETTQHYVPYLRRSRSKVRTPSPVRINSTRRVASSNRQRPPTVKQEELQDTHHQQSFSTLYSLTTTTESDNPPSPVTIEHEQQAIQIHRTPTSKSLRRIKAASTRTKSAKSIVLINPDDQSIAIIENSYVQGEPIRPVVKYTQSIKQTQFYGRNDDQSSENLLKPSQWPGCLGCLSRHMCLIIVICFFIILIGLAGAAVSAYFLITDSSNDTIPKIVGIVVGVVLAIAALCFLYIVLGCIGSRDGYFTYNDNDRSIGGRAFALIPPSHPNAHLYIPRDYMKLVENNHSLSKTQITTRPTSNIAHSRSSLRTPVSIKLYTQQQTMNRSNSVRDGLENKLNKDNITIEMPERLLIGREMSPRSREHSLNQFVKNIGHVVEDAKKRYNGDVPTKFIVQIDKNAV